MKILICITLFAFSLACNRVDSSNPGEANSNANQRASNNKKEKEQIVTLNEQGISLSLPVDWHKDELRTDANEGEFAWRGPDNTKVKVRSSKYKPEYSKGSIEEETNDFYKGHKEGGSEDVRFLEIGGVRGVHYHVVDEEHTILWASQYEYKGERQILFVNLGSPAGSFAKNRDALYGILNSIKFSQD